MKEHLALLFLVKKNLFWQSSFLLQRKAVLKKLLLLLITSIAPIIGNASLPLATYREVDLFAYQIGRKHNLTFLNSCLHSVIGGKDCENCFGLLFTSQKSLTLDEGRVLANKLLESLLTNTLLNKDNLAFKIAFWDKEVNRPLFPYLADIRFFNSKFHYYYANPKNQALETPIIE